ncbi:40S ribosomal protein S5-1 [Hordeum vulgare]|nr:40S ribosomal protein S5-1 [Hordeum vulgare]
MTSPKSPTDKIFEKVINPYLSGVLQHPQSIEMREGMLHIRDVEGPKKTGSMEARLEAMEQQVFKCQGMVERGLNANHMMITEFTSKHKIDANDIGKHLSRLYDRIDHLQAQIYDLQNQNYDARTLTFMCRDELFGVPRRSFCNALGYDDTGLTRDGGIHPHDRPHPMGKEMAGTGATSDASKWLWEELYSIVHYKLVPKYAPSIMCFLNSRWVDWRPGEPLSSPVSITENEIKQLQKKKHAATRFPDDAP